MTDDEAFYEWFVKEFEHAPIPGSVDEAYRSAFIAGQLFESRRRRTETSGSGTATSLRDRVRSVEN